MIPARRSWSRAAVEESLNLAARLPDFAGTMARFARASAAVAAAHPPERLATGPGAADYALHLRPRIAVDGAPLFLFIHGGYWRAGAAEDFLFVADPYLARGIDVLSLNYPLCPDVPFAELVERCTASVANVIARFPGRDIWIGGHSAGAHLALIACRAPFARGRIVRSLLVGGLYDLAPVRDSFLQPLLRLTDADVARFSPLFDPVAGEIAHCVAYGATETEIFRTQSADLHDLLATVGTSDIRAIAGKGHFDVLFALFDRDGPMLWPATIKDDEWAYEQGDRDRGHR